MPDWVLSCCQRVALCVIFMLGGVGEGWFPATGLQDVWSGGAVSSVSSSGLKTDRCLLHAVLRAACFKRFGHLLQALPLFKSVGPQRTTEILLPLNVACFVTARQCNRTQFQGTICDFHHCKELYLKLSCDFFFWSTISHPHGFSVCRYQDLSFYPLVYKAGPTLIHLNSCPPTIITSKKQSPLWKHALNSC